MQQNFHFGAGIWVFGQFVDRYATDGYGPAVSTLEAIERASKVKDLEFLDINYPFSSSDIKAQDVKDALDRHGLKAIAVTPVVYNQKYRKGSFTHPDFKVRQEAIDLGKEAIEIAYQLNADYVKFWTGQDGYDYPFQADYQQIWDFSVDGIRTVAESDPKRQFAIEYKSKEPRIHMFFDSAAKTLLAIEDMGVDNVGIVLDLGHSLFAKETPAEVIQMVHKRGKLVSVELNDNWREWDDDLTVGSIHLVETLEFLHAVRKIGWEKPLLLDQFPFREDPIEAANMSIKNIRTLVSLLDENDLSTLQNAQDNQDALKAQEFILQLLLGKR